MWSAFEQKLAYDKRFIYYYSLLFETKYPKILPFNVLIILTYFHTFLHCHTSRSINVLSLEYIFLYQNNQINQNKSLSIIYNNISLPLGVSQKFNKLKKRVSNRCKK